MAENDEGSNKERTSVKTEMTSLQRAGMSKGHPDHTVQGEEEKVQPRRDCDPDLPFPQPAEERFRSSNKTGNWNLSKGTGTSSAKEENTEHALTDNLNSIGKECNSDFPAMKLQSPTRFNSDEMSQSRGQTGSDVTTPKTQSHVSFDTDKVRHTASSDDKRNTASDDKRNPASDDKRNTASDDKKNPASDDKRNTISDDKMKTASDDKRNTAYDNKKNPVFDDKRNTASDDKLKTAKRAQDANQCSSMVQTSSEHVQTESAKPHIQPNVAVGIAGKDETILYDRGDVISCTTRVDFLTSFEGEIPKIISTKENILHMMSRPQSRFKIKNIVGLTGHLLQLENFKLEKLMNTRIPDKDIEETIVCMCLQEMCSHTKTIGDIVHYFTQERSKRLDIVQEIQKIHSDCPFCNRLFRKV